MIQTLPWVIAPASKYVEAAILSGITVCVVAVSFSTPSITIVLSPAPCIFAPQPFKKSARALISGSLAAFVITVVPFATHEAIIMFSVAPTDGNGKITLAA